MQIETNFPRRLAQGRQGMVTGEGINVKVMRHYSRFVGLGSGPGRKGRLAT